MVLIILSLPDIILKDFDEKSYNIKEELKENVVIIDFWASYCKPCIKMMPYLDSLYIKYKDSNLRLFGICVDSRKSVLSAKAIWYKGNFSYIPLWDWDNEVMKSFEVKVIPHIFILYKDEIVYKKIGYDENEKKAFEDTLRKILLKNLIEKLKGGNNE